MSDPILLTILFASLAVGATLFALLRAETRREMVRARLKTMGVAAPAVGQPGMNLRRSLPQGRARTASFLGGVLWARLNTELTATGNRIGVLHLAMVAGVAAAVVISFAHLLLGLDPGLTIALAGAAALLMPLLVLRLAQSRYRNKFLNLFPDALDLVARAVKAGLPVLDAMEVAAREIPAPVGSEFRRTLDEVHIGVEVDQALRNTANRIRIPDFYFYMVALILQRRTGGSLAEVLGNLSTIIRRRKELRLKVRALTAESKMSVTVLSALPFLTAIGMWIINHKLMEVLLSDPRGRFMVGLALVSIVIGTAVMAHMIKRSLR